MSPPITAEYSESTFFKNRVAPYEVIYFEISEVDKWVSLDKPWWLDQCLKKLDGFRDLELNWNSYDGLPVDHDLISQGKALLESISISGISEPFLAPVSDGGINIEWDTTERFLSIKIREKGVRFFYINRRNKADKQGGEIEIDEGLDSILKLLI